MAKKVLIIIAIFLLTVCLLSGGCTRPDESKLSYWRDLIKIPVGETAGENNTIKPMEKEKLEEPEEKGEVVEGIENINVQLYFVGANDSSLLIERREIPKVEGIARKTMEELIKGPANTEYSSVFPQGTQLRDINIKTDGLCIVDLSTEAGSLNNLQEEKFMVYAIAKTLGQFPTIKGVSFMINGSKVDTIGGYLDLSKPIVPYNL